MNYKHNREEVVLKGIDLFWNRGFHNLGVDQICKDTGMTKGAFYNAFKSKEQFLLTTLKAYGDLIVNHLENQLNTTKGTAFNKLTVLYKEMLTAQKDVNYKGCLVNNMMSELGALNISVAEIASNQFERFLDVLQPIVYQAQQDGDFDTRIDAKVLSEIIHTTFFGFLTRAKSTKVSMDKHMILFLKTLNTRDYEIN